MCEVRTLGKQFLWGFDLLMTDIAFDYFNLRACSNVDILLLIIGLAVAPYGVRESPRKAVTAKSAERCVSSILVLRSSCCLCSLNFVLKTACL